MGDARDMDRQSAVRMLRWQIEAGADEAVADEPLNRLAPPAAAAKEGQNPPRPTPPQPPAATREEKRPPRPTPPQPPAARPDAPAPASSAPEGGQGLFASAAMGGNPAECSTLEEIFAALDAMTDFPLRRTATHTVHAAGHPRARVMLIGEAPGREEDLQGRPFVGRSGQLLDRMLAAIGLGREEEDPERAVLISNVIFWRPPGNRKPTEAETAACLPWLERTIEIVRPEFIVCLGATPTQRLTGRTQGILKLRGAWFDYRMGERVIPLLATLHPAYLLRQPVQKRLAWRDFLSLKLRLEEGRKP